MLFSSFLLSFIVRNVKFSSFAFISCIYQYMLYLPDTELGVVEDVVSHGELSLVLRRANRLDLLHDAALHQQLSPVIHRHVR